MASKSQVAKWVGYLSEAFGRSVSVATIEAFVVGLADIPDEALERAGVQSLRTSKFMPSIAELRELAGVTAIADRAVLAWDAVLKSLSHGPYQHVDFDDGVINATIRHLGGWPEFYGRLSGSEQEKWTRKEFIDAYRSLSRAGVDGEACRPLVGLATTEGKKPLRIATGLPQVAGFISERDALPKLELRKP